MFLNSINIQTVTLFFKTFAVFSNLVVVDLLTFVPRQQKKKSFFIYFEEVTKNGRHLKKEHRIKILFFGEMLF